MNPLLLPLLFIYSVSAIAQVLCATDKENIILSLSFSSSDQVSFECPACENGYFAQAFIDAIDGKAAIGSQTKCTYNPDGYISASELERYQTGAVCINIQSQNKPQRVCILRSSGYNIPILRVEGIAPAAVLVQDRDGEGTLDSDDAYPTQAGIATKNGCTAEDKPLVEMVAIPGKSYKLSKYEVTIGQYLAFCKATNSHWPEWLEKGNEYNIYTGTSKIYAEGGMSESNTTYPITGVSALDADAFCKWAGGRLPSEEEWEYAAKGGQSYDYAGSSNIDEVAWYSSNNGSKCHAVGGKKANGYGLYDMTGNVWEWTSSSWGSDRVNRGGSWVSYSGYCGVTVRNSYTPNDRNIHLGFRLASQ